jgi:hypothetical protein
MCLRLFIPKYGLVALCMLWASPMVVGQTLAERGYEPVDQVVDDVDPLAVSLRSREPGLDATGQHHNVFRRIEGDGADRDRLYFIHEGIVAEFDRSEYRAIIDEGSNRRLIYQLIPPNTVFHIGLPPADALRSGQWGDELLLGQVDGRVAPPEIQTAPSPVPPPVHRPATGSRYRELVLTQRSTVVAALQRVASQDRATPTR